MAQAAVRALSYAEVDAVIDELNGLNPYDRQAVPSLIKLEPENIEEDPMLGPLRAIAISAKRYVLYRLSPDGLAIRKASNHGLGLYRSPLTRRPDRSEPWPEWVEAAWEAIIRELEGLDAAPESPWIDLPALKRSPLLQPVHDPCL